MNIRLVAVTERTREIGVRKSLRATARDIRNQFFAESATLMLISGAIGLGIGLGICLLFSSVELPDIVPHPVISPLAVIPPFLTLALITLAPVLSPPPRPAPLIPTPSFPH